MLSVSEVTFTIFQSLGNNYVSLKNFGGVNRDQNQQRELCYVFFGSSFDGLSTCILLTGNSRRFNN